MGCFVVAGFVLTSASNSPSAIAELLVSFPFLSYPILFCDPKFCWRPETKLYNWLLCGLLYMTSIPGYCIPRGIRIQKLPISPYFYPQTAPKMGVNRCFQAKRAKFSNFCIFKSTNAIATKFCTVIMTIKFSLQVVPKFATQIQNGGRPPS